MTGEHRPIQLTYLSDLTTLMVAPDQSDPVRVSHLQLPMCESGSR